MRGNRPIHTPVHCVRTQSSRERSIHASVPPGGKGGGYKAECFRANGIAQVASAKVQLQRPTPTFACWCECAWWHAGGTESRLMRSRPRRRAQRLSNSTPNLRPCGAARLACPFRVSFQRAWGRGVSASRQRALRDLPQRFAVECCVFLGSACASRPGFGKPRASGAEAGPSHDPALQ